MARVKLAGPRRHRAKPRKRTRAKKKAMKKAAFKLKLPEPRTYAKKVRAPETPARPTHPTANEFQIAQRYLSKDGLVDVDALTTEFKLTKGALAETLGFADETLQRQARVAAVRTQQRLREMLEILTRVEPWAGGMPQALGWYRGQGIPALGDQTAEALVKNDEARIVRAYLDAIAAGAFA